MTILQRSLLTAAFTLTIVFVSLIVLVRTGLAAHAGEIAFESNQNHNWEIYLLDVATGVTHNLTHSPADDTSPAWSPDGKQLAFVSDRDADNLTEVYVMDAEGRNVRRLRSDPGIYADPAWAADGRSLVVNHGWQQIVRVDITPESRTEQWLGIGFAPRLSADQRRMLYYANSPDSINSSIYMVNLSDNRITDLTFGPTYDWGAEWSPDGRQIVFVSSRTGRPGVYVMDADGSNVRAITGSGYDLSPSWTPDGRIIYASGTSGKMRLYIISADGSDRRALTHDTGSSRAPVWRPQPG